MDSIRRKNYERKLRRLGVYDEIIGNKTKTSTQNRTKQPTKKSLKQLQTNNQSKTTNTVIDRNVSTTGNHSNKSHDNPLPRQPRVHHRHASYPAEDERNKARQRNADQDGRHDGNVASNRQRYHSNSGYEESDVSYGHSPTSNSQDLSRERIETELRSSRIAETKVRKIAARLSQGLKTEGDNSSTPRNTDEVTARLKKIITNHLDLMLYGVKGQTDMTSYNDDTEELVERVYTMVKQLQGDVMACHGCIKTDDPDDLDYGRRMRSIPRMIQGELQELQTDYDVLYEKYRQVKKTSDNNIVIHRERLDNAVNVQHQNVQLQQEMKKIKDEWTVMAEDYTHTKAEEVELKERVRIGQEEKKKLDGKLAKLREVNNVLTDECNRVTDENIRLNQDVSQMEKDIRRLSEPDKKLIQKIHRLEKDNVELKTSNRRLENEKGLIKGALLKLEANYELIQKDKRELTKERNKFWKETEKLRTENRKLTLSH